MDPGVSMSEDDPDLETNLKVQDGLLGVGGLDDVITASSIKAITLMRTIGSSSTT